MNDEKFFPATIMPDADWWRALWPDPEALLRSLDIVPGLDVGPYHYAAVFVKTDTLETR